MIKNPEENNPKLTPEQLQSIDVVNQRLFVIQTETTIAVKTLNSIKGESAIALKDRQYQEELLLGVTSQILEAQAKLNTLNESNSKASEILSATTQEIGKKSDILAAMESEFKKREDNISSKEADLIVREASVEMREEDIKKSEELLQDKHAKIKVFAETI